VDPRACLDVREKSHPYWDSIAGPSSPQSVVLPTELPCPPSSGGTVLYIQQLVYAMRLCRLAASRMGLGLILLAADGHITTAVRIYRTVPPDDEQ
jgi:hypothetical protein